MRVDPKYKCVTWTVKRDTTLDRKQAYANFQASLARAEKELYAKLGEPVRTILRLMEEDPSRFEIKQKKDELFDEQYHAPGENDGYDYEMHIIDKRSGYQCKIVSFSRSSSHPDFYGDYRWGQGNVIGYRAEQNCEWMNEEELHSVFYAGLQVEIALEKVKRDLEKEALLKSQKEGRERAMELYKQDMQEG